MKNIADVNSDDILTELNNLSYDDDDELKLLDDEDIKPINNSSDEETDDELTDFYMDYEQSKTKRKAKVDLYTEEVKPVKEEESKPKVEVVKVAPAPKPEPVPTPAPAPAPNVDNYLNRPPKEENNVPNPLINNAKKEEPPHVSAPNNNHVEIQDLNQLFDKVSNNVKGASEIVSRNAEIKRKIDERFEELRRMQQEHEANKKSDYEEINAYKNDVYAKLQDKKAEIERDLLSLRGEQTKLANERKDFETYKNQALANLSALEKELKESYDSRNKNIEQVEMGLVKRKEQLDAERSAIAKERELLEKDRATLANNLLQFNKLVDEFTKGIDNFN